MNVRAMQKGVQQQLTAMDVPMVSEDIVYYLNRAQEQYIDEQYVYLRGKYTDNQNIELYQNSQKAIENLRSLVVHQLATNANVIDAIEYDNAKVFSFDTLTYPFYYYVRSQTQLAFGGEWVNNRLIEQENIQKFIQTKYNKPVFRDFLVLLQGNSMYVFYDSQDGSDVYDISLTYIKTPGELVLDNPSTGETTTSALPIHTHKDIVNLAVKLILEDQNATGNPRLREIQGSD